KIESIAQGSTGAKTLYAQWTLITYTITYEGLNGVENPNTATSYTVETETITLQDFSHDDYTFEGWFDAETGGNKVTSIPKGSTGNKTLYAHCTWKWIGTKNPITAKAVGDIVFSDGSATPYSTNLTLSDAQKKAAVAVIFYAGSASDTLGAKTLGVGLKNTNTLQWARYTSSDDKAEGYSTNITAIQCTPSESGSGKAATATFTGDFDGSDNWKTLCDAVSDEETSGKYPAWEWVNAYATENSLEGSYANGWYLPTLAELSMLYRVKDTVDSALEKADGTKIADMTYWSSSQNASYGYIAWNVSFYDGYLDDNPKTDFYAVCTVRAF
ncbi:MAG: InlB B-repeat-containing protein, partial [Treponema sp.]|nr:InlB B-repeat-containing protein [Treponema sp.]